MTGWHISIGYNGHGTSNMSKEDMWERLKRHARHVADRPDLIIAEARRLGAEESCKRGCCTLDTYADNYKDPFGTPGHPVKIIETEADGQIMQLASTDDNIKYDVRRAYVRLLIEAMHRERIDINVETI